MRKIIGLPLRAAAAAVVMLALLAAVPAMAQDVRIIGWRESGLSFPSGHTSQVFFLASFLMRSLEFTPFGAFTLYMVAELVGLTRMYVGAHYPRDVLAGALLGTVWGVLIILVDLYFVSIGV